jgi:hypothetical protein
MPSVATREKPLVADASPQAFLRSAVEQVKNIEALGKLDDKVLLTTIRKGAGTTSKVKLLKAFLALSRTANRVAALLEPTASVELMQAARTRGLVVREVLVAHKVVLPSGEFSAALNISRQALSKAVQAGRLFALEVGGENYYPSFYLDSEVDRRKLERVSKALGALAGWEKWRFFTTPKGSLAGLTPIDALKKGKYAEVLTAAAGFTER